MTNYYKIIKSKSISLNFWLNRIPINFIRPSIVVLGMCYFPNPIFLFFFLVTLNNFTKAINLCLPGIQSFIKGPHNKIPKFLSKAHIIKCSKSCIIFPTLCVFELSSRCLVGSIVVIQVHNKLFSRLICLPKCWVGICVLREKMGKIKS